MFVDFGKKFSTRRTSCFDVDGRHPNIERVGRTPWKAYDYAIKDGDVVCGGAERPEESRSGNGETDHKWSRIADAETADEFWELCRTLDPRALCINFGNLQRYADWKFRPVPTPYTHPRSITFTDGDSDGRDDWLSQSQIGSGLPRVGT